MGVLNSGRSRDGLTRTPLDPSIRGPQPLEHVVLDGEDLAADGLAAVEGLQLDLGVAVEEEGHRVPVPAALVDDPVHGALVDAVGPQRQHVPDVDDVCVRVGRHGVPRARVLVQDLEAARGVLQEQRDGPLVFGERRQ